LIGHGGGGSVLVRQRKLAGSMKACLIKLAGIPPAAVFLRNASPYQRHFYSGEEFAIALS
jgi:formate hydrogenlyase subunit 3/multisubunit Na+/H+ antiporter MnhD subunit